MLFYGVDGLILTHDETEPIPSCFDWRSVNGKSYITPVKDQKQCGSCVAFASIASVEARLRISFGCPVDKDTLPTLSEANAYFCHGGDCSGITLSTVLRNIKQSGVVPEANMKYFTVKKGTTIDCYSDCANKRGTKNCKIKNGDPDEISTWLTSYRSVNGIDNMKRAIIHYGPIVAAYSSGVSIIAYVDGVYKPLEDEEVFSDHAICLIGYDDNKRCFIYKNSWGKNWGNKGFGEILGSERGIGTLVNVPSGFRGYLAFTYQSAQFQEKRDWSLAVRAIYIPGKEADESINALLAGNYPGVRDCVTGQGTPQKGIVVGEYVIKGKA